MAQKAVNTAYLTIPLILPKSYFKSTNIPTKPTSSKSVTTGIIVGFLSVDISGSARSKSSTNGTIVGKMRTGLEAVG